MAYLITPSLYNSFLYYTKGDFELYGENAEEKENQAKEDFLNTLNKVEIADNEAIQKGINFEDAVRSICENTGKQTSLLTDENELRCAKEVAEIVKNGFWQKRMYKRLGNYLIYAKADVVKRDFIYDIKRTSSYEPGKYQNSIQHLIELECTLIDKFKYLICDGKTVFIEDYHKKSNNQEILLGKINEMVAWIKANTVFAEAFEKNWIAREDDKCKE